LRLEPNCFGVAGGQQGEGVRGWRRAGSGAEHRRAGPPQGRCWSLQRRILPRTDTTYMVQTKWRGTRDGVRVSEPSNSLSPVRGHIQSRQLPWRGASQNELMQLMHIPSRGRQRRHSWSWGTACAGQDGRSRPKTTKMNLASDDWLRGPTRCPDQIKPQTPNRMRFCECRQHDGLIPFCCMLLGKYQRSGCGGRFAVRTPHRVRAPKVSRVPMQIHVEFACTVCQVVQVDTT
jgi:hypothetical protein